MMSELKLQAAASVKPVRAMSCMCAEQREAACATQAEGEKGGRDDDGAEAAGGESHACQGDELHARRAARGSLCQPPKPRARKAAEKMMELKLKAAASVTPVRARSCARA
jgi:hypothetical protein